MKGVKNESVLKIVVKVGNKASTAGGASTSAKGEGEAAEISHIFHIGSPKAGEVRENLSAKLLELMSIAEPPFELDKVHLRILETDKKVAQLYNELVKTGTISKQDFWATRQNLYLSEKLKMEQKAGLANAAEHELRPKETPSGDHVYSFTPQEIHAIFTHYPKIHQAYQENVPDKITEEEFWNRYIYFKNKLQFSSEKAKIRTATEFFNKYVFDEDLERHKKQKRDINPLVDLTATADAYGKFNGNVDITYVPTQHGAILNKLSDTYHYHAAVVLNSIEDNGPKESPESQESNDELFKNSILLDDLQMETPEQPLPLQLKDTSRYFANQFVGQQEDKSGDLMEYQSDNVNLKKTLGDWTPKLKEVNKSSIRKHQLSKRFPFSATLESGQKKPNFSMDSSLLSLFHRCNELLRHFWCSRENTQKLIRMKKVLDHMRQQLAQKKAIFEQDSNLNSMNMDSKLFAIKTLDNLINSIERVNVEYFLLVGSS